MIAVRDEHLLAPFDSSVGVDFVAGWGVRGSTATVGVVEVVAKGDERAYLACAAAVSLSTQDDAKWR